MHICALFLRVQCGERREEGSNRCEEQTLHPQMWVCLYWAKRNLCSLLGKGKHPCRGARQRCCVCAPASGLVLVPIPPCLPPAHCVLQSPECSVPCSPPVSWPLSLPHSHQTPSYSSAHQTHCCHRAFAHAVPAFWNTCPFPRCLSPRCLTSSYRKPSLIPSDPTPKTQPRALELTPIPGLLPPCPNCWETAPACGRGICGVNPHTSSSDPWNSAQAGPIVQVNVYGVHEQVRSGTVCVCVSVTVCLYDSVCVCVYVYLLYIIV